MDYIYPINLEGHEDWLESGYDEQYAGGDIVTNDGEVIGTWLVEKFTAGDLDAGGRYEFRPNGSDDAVISEGIGILDSRVSRGLALIDFVNAIRAWHKDQGAT